MEIVSNRIPATPRSKYHKYMTASAVSMSSAGGGGSASIDTSNFVVKTGETEQTVEGSFGATGDIVAFKTAYSYFDSYLPIASAGALGCIKVGENLTITDDGTLNAQAGGGAANWDELQGKPSGLNSYNWSYAYTNAHNHDNKTVLDNINAYNVSYWDAAVSYMHTHGNISYLDAIDQNLSTTSDVNFNSVKAANDIVAFSTGITPEKFPIASTGALGCIKVGENLTITDDGTLNAQAGGGAANWDELQGKPSGLTSENITRWNTASDKAHTHDNKSTLDNISSTNVSNWNSAANNVHWHSNMTELDNITSTNISNWNSAVSNSHWHSNKSTLDNINQNLSTSSTPTFGGGLVTGSTSGLNIQHSSGNSINGRNGTSIANLYFNYTDANKNVLVDKDANIRAYGDVIAYNRGSNSAPFKYWYPSVDSNGNLSWTNSTSTTTPYTVNIKGPKGDKGDAGKSVGKVSAYTTSSTSGGSSTYRVYDTSNALLGSFTVYNGAKGEKGDTGPQGPQGPKGENGSSTNTWTNIYIKGTSWPAVVINDSGASKSCYIHQRSDSTLYFAYGTNNYHCHSFLANGNVWHRGSVSQNSDLRIKNIISKCDITLDDIDKINNYHFRFKNEDDSYPIRCGVIAQELLENDKFKPFVQSNIDDNGDELYSVNYSELGVAIASNGVKQLYELVKQQQSKIDALEYELNKIKNNIQ